MFLLPDSVAMTPNKANGRRILSPALIVSAGLTLLVCILVWLHWLPLGIPGEWVWEYQPRVNLGSLGYVVPGALLLLLGIHLLWKHGLKKSRAVQIAVVVGLVALSLLVRYCTWKAMPFVGVRMTLVTMSDVATTYYSQALDVRDTKSFLGEYPRLMSAMPYHARTHPPGAIIFMHWVYSVVRRSVSDPDKSLAGRVLLEVPPSEAAKLWAERFKTQGAGKDYTALEVLGAFWVGLVIALLGALVVLPIYFTATDLFGWRAGLVAGVLGAVIPSGLLFPVSVDQLVFVVTAVSLWLLVTGIRKRRLLRLLGSGIVLGVGLGISFGLLVLVPGFLVFILWASLGKERWRRTAAECAVFLAAVVAPAALLWAFSGCDMLMVYQKAVEAHRFELTQVWHRSYGRWVVGNLGDFLLLGGLPGLVYFLAFLTGGEPNEKEFKLGRKLGWTFLGILLLVDSTGLVRGEAGRIWLFLMAFPTILGAGVLAEERPGWAPEALVALALQYLLAVSLQANAQFLSVGPV